MWSAHVGRDCVVRCGLLKTAGAAGGRAPGAPGGVGHCVRARNVRGWVPGARPVRGHVRSLPAHAPLLAPGAVAWAGGAVTGEDRRLAGRVAIQLQRSAREIVRAVQAADAGDGRALVHILQAELCVEGVRDRLRELRRGVAVTGMIERRVGGSSDRPRGPDGRFQKVSKDGAR